MASKRYAFFCPQGTLLLKKNLYIRRQGSTAENGGQVIYAIEMARALAQLGHSIDIYARNYVNSDFDFSKDILIEVMEDYPNVRIIHVPTSAPEHIEKENFYPYYAEYLTYAYSILKQEQYDYIIGHYADGMFMATVAEEILFRHDGRRLATLGITHSLGKEKAFSLLENLKSEIGTQKEVIRKIYLSEKFKRASKVFNLKPRLSCERAAIKRLDGIMPVSQSHVNLLTVNYSYPPERLLVVAGGINQRVFRNLKLTDEQKVQKREELIEKHIELITESKRNKLQQAEIIIGFGRMIRLKGIFEAVKSMEYILQEHPNAMYVYIGGNIPPKTSEEKEVYTKSIQYARERGYENSIIFLGRQSQEKINEWLNVADIYLHCAHLEPFGLAPQEAASTGVAVAMSRFAGACDVLKDKEHVLYIHPLQPEDISQKVNLLLSDKNMAKQLASAAQALTVSECTWIARAREMDKFCASIEKKYTPLRIHTTDTAFPLDDNIQAAGNMLFQRNEKSVPEEMQNTYRTISKLMENILTHYPEPKNLVFTSAFNLLPLSTLVQPNTYPNLYEEATIHSSLSI